jgi:hypothetical protein
MVGGMVIVLLTRSFVLAVIHDRLTPMIFKKRSQSAREYQTFAQWCDRRIHVAVMLGAPALALPGTYI